MKRGKYVMKKKIRKLCCVCNKLFVANKSNAATCGSKCRKRRSRMPDHARMPMDIVETWYN
jgi:hypothetical protein